jgi:hypothetical protein
MTQLYDEFVAELAQLSAKYRVTLRTAGEAIELWRLYEGEEPLEPDDIYDCTGPDFD